MNEVAFWEVAAREWSAGSQLQQEVPDAKSARGRRRFALLPTASLVGEACPVVAGELLKLPRAVGGRRPQSQLMKVKLQQAVRVARVGMGASSWVRLRLRNARVLPSSWVRPSARALPGHLLMKMKLQQVAREGEAGEGEAVAREVARESGSCAFPACPSQSLSATGRAKTDRQSQWRRGDTPWRSAEFAPRAGRLW